MIKVLIAVIVVLSFVGCAGVPKPTQAQIDSAYYGPEPTQAEIEQAVKDAVSSDLIDPNSLTLTFDAPRQGYDNMAIGVVYGWKVCGKMNAKNKFGGYAGPVPFYALVSGGTALRLVSPVKNIPDTAKMGVIASLMKTSKSADTFCK